MGKLVSLLLILIVFIVHNVQSRRGPPPEDDYDHQPSRNSVMMDVGEFPFQRGERPIFNFDQGDEGFIGTIPDLIEGLDKIKNVMHQQRKITQAFGEAFDTCEVCG